MPQASEGARILQRLTVTDFLGSCDSGCRNAGSALWDNHHGPQSLVLSWVPGRPYVFNILLDFHKQFFNYIVQLQSYPEIKYNIFFWVQNANIEAVSWLNIIDIVNVFASLLEESACNAGDPDSIPGLGTSNGEGIGYSLQYSGLENSMDCIVHVVTKSQT